jgi:hypothetical protein
MVSEIVPSLPSTAVVADEDSVSSVSVASVGELSTQVPESPSPESFE